MKKTTGRILLIVLAALMIGSLAACGSQNNTSSGTLQINTVEVIPSAYLNEVFDLRDIILMEDGVEYTATICCAKYTLDESAVQYTFNEYELEVQDLCFVPTAVEENIVTITAKRDKEIARKVVVVPTIIRADVLDELLYSGGIYSISDPGISKSINMESEYIKGENSQTSMYVTFSGMDPHPWGNTFLTLDSAEVQRHFTDKTWKNAVLTFWVYNPNDQAVEFQLRIADPVYELNIDWNPADGPHKQIAQPNQWTQIFFPLRKLGVVNPVVSTQFVTCALNLKMRYENYSTTTSYSYSFYLDGLDIVDGSQYPHIDNNYVLSDEELEQGWENMAQDIGWQGVYTEYNYENTQGENSTCSLKAYFNNEKALTNSFICLAPEMDERIDELPDMTGGKFSAYFKFENMNSRVTLDIINKQWANSNQVDLRLTPVGDGWYYGEVNLENLQVGTGRNDQIIRIRLNFYGVSQDSVVYVDTCKFEYKYVHKVLESVSADWINITPDSGPFYYIGNSQFVTSHLQGGNSVRSLKLVAPSGSNGKYTLDTATAAINGEIFQIPNMNYGTLGAWFYFGDQAPSAYVALTNELYYGSNGVDFIFTKNAGDGWYYGELHGSDFACAEGGGTSKIIRISILVPAGYTVYIDNLHWDSSYERELIAAELPKPSSPSYSMVAGENLMVDLEVIENPTSLSFEYKVDSGAFNLALVMPDWNSYYGYYAFDEKGNVDPYDGVTIETLEDGYVRVTMDIAALNKKVGTPNAGFTIFYIRGEWTDANGIIRNVILKADKENTPNKILAGVPVISGSDSTILTECDEKLSRLSFDYKITAGDHFNIVLMPDWDNYYGYFAFDINGNVDPYDGVSCEKLANGYIRVTFDLEKLTKFSGNPNSNLAFLYIRGEWTDAMGEITNIYLYWDEIEMIESKGLTSYKLQFLVSNKTWTEQIIEEKLPFDE